MRFAMLIAAGAAALATPAQASDPRTACGGYVMKVGRATEIAVTEAAAKCEWPFKADDVTFKCQNPRGLDVPVVELRNGETYALTGIARMHLRMDGIDAIWKDNPKIPGTKINIGPWIDAANALCGR